MRVSNLGLTNRFISQIDTNRDRLYSAEKQASSGKKIDRVSQSPVDAINSIFHRIRSNQIEQYQKNIDHLKGAVDISHDTLSHMTDILQDVRELTVRAANGIVGSDDRRNMASEVEELLTDLVQTTESKYKDSYLFSGADGKEKPFEISYKNDNELGRPVIDGVRLLGKNDVMKTDIDLGNTVSLDISPNKLFWSDPNGVTSRQDGANYVVNRNQKISVNGKEIDILAGDNLDSIVQRINSGNSGVTAIRRNLPTGESVLSLQSSYPKKMELLDLGDGTVLRDLGILKVDEQGDNLQENLSPDAIQSNGSLFDAVIDLRESLLKNDAQRIGGFHLGAIDNALKSLLSSQASVSAVGKRIDDYSAKLSTEEVRNTEQLSKSEDIDMGEAMMQLNEAATLHRISLMANAKINETTLMDYLK